MQTQKAILSNQISNQLKSWMKRKKGFHHTDRRIKHQINLMLLSDNVQEKTVTLHKQLHCCACWKSVYYLRVMGGQSDSNSLWVKTHQKSHQLLGL